MKFSKYLNEQNQSEVRAAFERTLNYCKETQKGELQLRDAINNLCGNIKNSDKYLYDLLDEILKNTK